MGRGIVGQGTREQKTGNMATEDGWTGTGIQNRGWDEGAKKDRRDRNMELGIGTWGGG